MTKDPQVINVASAELDDYGNLKVTDNLGNEYKVNKKHENLHELFIPGRAVKLIWDNYKGKDYIDNAELFDGKPPLDKQVEPITANAPEKLPPTPRVDPRSQEIAEHVMIKELGNRVGDGSLERDYPKDGAKIKVWYYNRIFKVLNIKKE